MKGETDARGNIPKSVLSTDRSVLSSGKLIDQRLDRGLHLGIPFLGSDVDVQVGISNVPV